VALALKDRHSVRIAGPSFLGGVWPPLADQEDIEINAVNVGQWPTGCFKLWKLFKFIDGDILIACKPFLSSLGVGTVYRFLKGTPLVLDADDWERGHFEDHYRRMSPADKFKRLVYAVLFPLHINSYFNVRLSEKLVPLADAVVVANRFLQAIYGGLLLYHCRESREHSPVLEGQTERKTAYGLGEDERVVMFLGTPRRHKGIESLIEAVAALKREDVTLMVVGMMPGNTICDDLEKKGKDALGRKFVSMEMQPVEKVSDILGMADLVVIPQAEGMASRGQIPAKLFDAMAEGRPVIATACGEIPQILEGCGVVVEPDNRGALTEAMRQLLDDPKEASLLGEQAYLRYKERYCREVMAEGLNALIERVVEDRGRKKRFGATSKRRSE
jgi:glycosyltransferase involved in cell wall biosynthesis